LDALLVAQGFAPDLRKAAAMVMAGEVIVGDKRVDKAGAQIRTDAALRVRGRKGHGYVSRGGLKLAGALDRFELDPTGWVAVDLGASTGGFTDCMLRRGARRVYAVDVAYGILDYRLQIDARVVNLERTHARDLTAELIPEPVDLVVADISFNTLTRLLAPAVALMAPASRMVLLVKPQFEAAPEAVGAGGIVRDPAVRAAALARVSAAVVALGFEVVDAVESPITGTKGNIELLLYARRSALS
jgi:23S rRNA (cytidine1920-2'-O)/16S rRNA (cytidine1409-2'-O)-methyltransferase